VTLTQPVYVYVALGIQHAKCMLHIITCGLTRSTRFFHIFSQTTKDFRKTLLNVKCVSQVSLQLLSETFFILRRVKRDIKNVNESSCKVSFTYSCPILIKIVFSRQIFKNTQISNYMKIHPVGTELFHADGQTDRRKEGRTDMTKQIVAFRNFANAPKNGVLRLVHVRLLQTFTQANK